MFQLTVNKLPCLHRYIHFYIDRQTYVSMKSDFANQVRFRLLNYHTYIFNYIIGRDSSNTLSQLFRNQIQFFRSFVKLIM